MQDAAYGKLLREPRRALHARIAEILEGQFAEIAESQPELLARHETIAIADIYVPIKRRATLEQKRVDEIAASILDKGLQSPILVRVDGARFVCPSSNGLGQSELFRDGGSGSFGLEFRRLSTDVSIVAI